MASPVYSVETAGRSHSAATGLVPQMLAVFEAAGFAEMISPGDAVAIKLHCGEWNNTAYLRPVYARTLADRIKALGGRPFVCDTTTLTYGRTTSRASGLDILITAERNGYTPAALGCPFIVADGFNGTDDVRVALPEGFILKEAFVANAIAMADVLITLTHFKGHPLGVIGGSIKNLGIGAQSKRGKHNVHMGGHPKYGLGAATDFHPERCKGRSGCDRWEICESVCPYGLFHVTETSIEWDRERCTSCLAHFGANTWCGVTNFPEIAFQATNAAMADACLATVKAVGKQKVGFINMAIDVSPACDCVGFADMPIVPHLGVFAGRDPVALDKATVDRAAQAPGMPGSAAEDYGAGEPGCRKFTAASAVHFSGLSEEIQIETGAINGLGSKEYEIVAIEPLADSTYWRFPDARPAGEKYARLYAKEDPFPRERYAGQGFDRKPEVDLDRVTSTGL
ncbi:MAG: DUF362 domain-containing protein [Chloroflexi bacterium]|nr:DUF362 domain-containing protein [Chloroflexota bacterium]